MTMGGKREFRRCVSLVEDRRHLSDSIAQSCVNPSRNCVTTFCPVSIQIEGCSDDDTAANTRTPQETQLVTFANLKANHHGRTSPCHSESRSSTPSPSVPSSPNFLDVPKNSDLSILKATAARLNLRTRTSSFLAWQATWLDKSRPPPEFPILAEGEGTVDKLTEERKKRINQALVWLKTELKELQSMDQHLARQLLTLRHDMHQLRLSRSCQQHQDLLDEVQSQMEEHEELSDVLDFPQASLNDTPLQHIGVTRMNICARRFSTC